MTPNKLLATLLCAAAMAGAFAQTTDETAEALMRKSGLWQQLGSMGTSVAAGMRDGIKTGGAVVPPGQQQRLQQVAEQAFGADGLRQRVRAHLAQHLSPAQLPPLQRWFDSPLGQRTARLEEAAAAEAAPPQVMMARATPLLEAMPPERRALLAEMVDATRLVEVMGRVTTAMALATHRGVSSLQPQAAGPSTAEVATLLEAQRAQMAPALQAYGLASFALAYESLPQDALRAYADLLKSDAGRHYSDVGGQALVQALGEASEAFGRGLGGLRPQSNS